MIFVRVGRGGKREEIYNEAGCHIVFKRWHKNGWWHENTSCFFYLHKGGNDTATGVVIMTDGREGGEREWMRIKVASCSNGLEHVYKDP